jgi:fido (protein-threonine AMPylation protein)
MAPAGGTCRQRGKKRNLETPPQCIIVSPAREGRTQKTIVMCRLNQIHPFREGNGRTQRLFVEQLASNAGYDLDFSHVSENDMRNASFAASVQGDTRLMRYLIFSNMTETGALGPVEYVREQPVSSEQVGLRDRFVGGIKKMRVVAVTCRIWIQRLKL